MPSSIASLLPPFLRLAMAKERHTTSFNLFDQCLVPTPERCNDASKRREGACTHKSAALLPSNRAPGRPGSPATPLRQWARLSIALTLFAGGCSLAEIALALAQDHRLLLQCRSRSRPSDGASVSSSERSFSSRALMHSVPSHCPLKIMGAEYPFFILYT
ncbi:hypothetical protein K438DRAFT_2025411 [Mycena galopus ATCC 62051]|nr:hypothetical protein K438DRAFT_2025411 [Mycena galopus ATCC 62051]